jgi:hypothetical protein
MSISAISHERKAFCRYKSKNCLSARNMEKISAMNVNGLSAISSMQQAPFG